MDFLVQSSALLAVATADVAFVALSVAFFAVAGAFAWFCEKVR